MWRRARPSSACRHGRSSRPRRPVTSRPGKGRARQAMDGRLQVFTGNSNPVLAAKIAGALEIPLGRRVVGTWQDGETRVELEENVRGSDVFVIQSICNPVNHNLVELLLMLD